VEELLGINTGFTIFTSRPRHSVMGPARLCLIAALVCPVLSGSVKKSFDKNEYMVYFPENQQESCHAIVFGVGTFMSCDQYSVMSEALVQKGFAVVIMDAEKGSMSKLNFRKSKTAIEFAKENLQSWAPTCTRINKWILGGHSAGGGTAHAVAGSIPSIADAMFQMDPFDIGLNGNNAVVTIPSLIWGFDFTSCFVTKEKAAAKAFEYTSSDRSVFVRVKEVKIKGCLFSSPKFLHCSVADAGCTGCTNCNDTPPEFYRDVANTVEQFVLDAFARSWKPEVMNLKVDVPVERFDGSIPDTMASCNGPNGACAADVDFAVEKLVREYVKLR